MFLKLTTIYVLLECCYRIYGAVTFNCYVCTYTLSSDPRLDYECADEPWNVTKGLPSVSCSTPNQCVTRVSLSQGKTQIRSVSRSCLPPQEICSGENCCSTDGVYPTCEHKCRTDMCNNQNAEQYLSQGGGSGAAGLYDCLFVNLLLVVTYFTSISI